MRWCRTTCVARTGAFPSFSKGAWTRSRRLRGMSSRSNAASDMTSRALGRGCCELSQESISDRTKAGILDPRPVKALCLLHR